jgi:hypothetical protein
LGELVLEIILHLGYNTMCTTRVPPEMSFNNRFEVFTHHLSSSQLNAKNEFLSMQSLKLG